MCHTGQGRSGRRCYCSHLLWQPGWRAGSNQAAPGLMFPTRSHFAHVCFLSESTAVPRDGMRRLLFVEAVTSQDCFLYAPFPAAAELVGVYRLKEGSKGASNGLHLSWYSFPKQVSLRHISPGCSLCCMWELSLAVKCLAHEKGPPSKIHLFEHFYRYRKAFWVHHLLPLSVITASYSFGVQPVSLNPTAAASCHVR